MCRGFFSSPSSILKWVTDRTKNGRGTVLLFFRGLSPPPPEAPLLSPKEEEEEEEEEEKRAKHVVGTLGGGS